MKLNRVAPEEGMWTELRPTRSRFRPAAAEETVVEPAAAAGVLQPEQQQQGGYKMY
jgi:hypothetical protein